jgi:hypothetical protein
MAIDAEVSSASIRRDVKTRLAFDQTFQIKILEALDRVGKDQKRSSDDNSEEDEDEGVVGNQGLSGGPTISDNVQ